FIGLSNLGALVGGSNATVRYTGLATTSQPAISNLLYSTGGAGVAGVATTSASCTGSLSCSTFAVLGASPITITSSAATFPFTTTSYGVATSTTLGFLNGFISTASSTFTAAPKFSTITNAL